MHIPRDGAGHRPRAFHLTPTSAWPFLEFTANVGDLTADPRLKCAVPVCTGHGIAAQYRGGGPAAQGGFKAYLFGDTLKIGTEIYKDELAQCGPHPLR